MLYQIFGCVPARTRQFVPFVQGARSRFTYDVQFFCYAKIASLCYWVARMAIPVGKWVGFVRFIIFLISVSVKVLPVIPLLSGVFVHRAFCAYFLRIERVVGNA